MSLAYALNNIPWLWLASVVAGLIGIAILVQLLRALHRIRQPLAHLEITPLVREDRSLEATGKLFTALHGLGQSLSWRERLLGARHSISCEMVATKTEGIRFVISAPDKLAANVEKLLHAYLPSAKVSRVHDPLAECRPGKIVAFRQQKHYAYPLQSHDSNEEHDPVSYVANAMADLEDGELMAVQFLVRPVYRRQAKRLEQSILRNEDVTRSLNGKNTFATAILSGVNKLALGIVDVFSISPPHDYKDAYSASRTETARQQQVAKGIRPARTLSYFEHELVESIHRKLASPLARTDIRVLVRADTNTRVRSRIKNIASAVHLYNVPDYQNLGICRPAFGWLQRLQLTKRMHALHTGKNIFATHELAYLFHFPHALAGTVDDVIRDMSKTMPPPVSLKDERNLDVIVGENIHHKSRTKIGLSRAERERHMYIIGGTGSGKTTMMLYGIVQDIENGKGVGVIDPHGDLADTILGYIPEERIQDMVYINPDDLSHPVGINLLELTPGLEGDELLREKDLITESVISVLRKLFSEDDDGGHRIEYVLRNTIQTALTLEGATLFTIFHLLNDTTYRKSVVRNLRDKDLKTFWQNELGKAGDFQRVKMAAGITAKIGRFLFSASAKRVLEQGESTVQFEDVLNEGKILICNFSKGLLGEDTSTLFGTTVLAKLQVAALRRARINQEQRRPFYLYVDEFQNFATKGFMQMLSESRKYKLYLTMAEQSTQQQEQQRLTDVILSNVGTVVCFRSGSPADERLLLPLFTPYIEEGEIANLPAYNFYMRIAAVEPKEPLSGSTLLLEENADYRIAKKVTQESRNRYTIGEKTDQSKDRAPQSEKPETRKTRTTVKSKNTSI